MDWASPEELAGLRVGDMAGGTGALLTAVYRRVAEQHRVAGGDESDIHKSLVEDVLGPPFYVLSDASSEGVFSEVGS